MRREPTKGLNERDWISKRWRRILCSFHNRTGLGKRVKRAINKRARHRAKREIEEEKA